jgi:hypothetical protein
MAIRSETGVPQLRLSDTAFIYDIKLPGAKMASLHLFAPEGTIYLEASRPVGGDGRVQIRIPVRGTPASDYGMSGRWVAKVHRDNQAAPALEQAFDIGDAGYDSGVPDGPQAVPAEGGI